jgi:hypothetical protein
MLVATGAAIVIVDRDDPLGKLGQTATDFRVKLGTSVRNPGIDYW